MPSENPRRVVVLGSTGSIGRQAVALIAGNPDLFTAVALAAGRDEVALRDQAARLGVTETGLGEADAARLAAHPDADVVLNAVVGAAGLRASIAALEAGKILALANKESLVAGGELCVAAAARGGGVIVPVDSEHAAIAQCLAGVPRETVERVTLTASGGPFRTRTDVEHASRAEALAHPTWSMGPKITIDSATMMNKGLEVIEAHHLFGIGYERIDVLIHPQSVVHGVVTLRDGSVLMQAAPADMTLPIRAALTWPDRPAAAGDRLDLAAVGSLEFETPDRVRWPALDLSYRAGRLGGSWPTVLNAANEVAVAAFLADRIRFGDITRVVEAVLEDHEGARVATVQDVFEVDAAARRAADQVCSDRERSGTRATVGARE